MQQSPPNGDWRAKIAFVADRAYDSNGNPDAAANFWALSDSIAGNSQYIPAPFSADRIYYNPCNPSTYPQCVLAYPPYATAQSARDAIVAAMNDGRLIVNYLGHAGITLWGKDQIFRLDEVNALANGGIFPVMLAMTCYDGYFHFPGLASLAETNVQLNGRGAVASWSATGLGVATGHDYLDRGFFDAVMRQKIFQIGQAAVIGKTNLWANGGGANRDLIDTFNLLGDPATRLAVPPEFIPTYTIYFPVVAR